MARMSSVAAAAEQLARVAVDHAQASSVAASKDTVSELKRIAELVEQASSHVEQLDMRLDAMQAQQTLQWAISSADQVYQFEYMKKDPGSASAVRLTSGNLVKKVLCAFMRNAGFWVPNGCYIPAAMPAAAASVGSAARSSSGFGRTSSSGSAGAFGSGASSSSQKASDATEASREAFRKQLAQQISELTGVQPRFELEKTATGIEQYRIYRL